MNKLDNLVNNTLNKYKNETYGKMQKIAKNSEKMMKGNKKSKLIGSGMNLKLLVDLVNNVDKLIKKKI